MPRKAVRVEKITEGFGGNHFGQLFSGPPLPCAVVIATLLENALMTLLSTHFVKCSTSENMFKPNGELESFSKCTRMAYCLGFISKIMMDNLTKIGAIRNRFAHNVNAIDFDDPEVRELCCKLAVPKIPMTDEMIAQLGLDPSIPNLLQTELNKNPRGKFVVIGLITWKWIMAIALKVHAHHQCQPLGEPWAWEP